MCQIKVHKRKFIIYIVIIIFSHFKIIFHQIYMTVHTPVEQFLVLIMRKMFMLLVKLTMKFLHSMHSALYDVG